MLARVVRFRFRASKGDGHDGITVSAMQYSINIDAVFKKIGKVDMILQIVRAARSYNATGLSWLCAGR